MIVYAESNFLLEIAYQQPDWVACEGILKLAEEGKVSLVVPAFSIAEATFSQAGRRERREAVIRPLKEAIHELGRTQKQAGIKEKAGFVFDALVESNEDDTRNLRSVQERVLTAAEIVPLTHEIIRAAMANRTQFSLKLPDAIVLETVTTHLNGEKPSSSLFVNKNSKDFLNPDIVKHLEKLGCGICGNFEEGARAIQGQIAGSV